MKEMMSDKRIFKDSFVQTQWAYTQLAFATSNL